ncbi:hypothetical protein F4806DRAFT_136726 [Annulohypoxylon nitens]|nr:hypothetical protein F4806DRAFT_136726 [Annulohypoxylon nitens]
MLLKSFARHFRATRAMPTHEAMIIIRQARYTREDCLKGTMIKQWAMALLRACRAANFTDPQHQMALIYDALAEDLRLVCVAPTKTTTLDGYLDHLNDKQKVWRAQLIAQGETGPRDIARNKCRVNAI